MTLPYVTFSQKEPPLSAAAPAKYHYFAALTSSAVS